MDEIIREINKRGVIADTDFISAFIQIHRMDIVQKVIPEQIFVPNAVVSELERNARILGNEFIYNDFIRSYYETYFKLRTFNSEMTEAYIQQYLRMQGRFGEGEIQAYLIACKEGYVVASNNTADIRNFRPPITPLRIDMFFCLYQHVTGLADLEIESIREEMKRLNIFINDKPHHEIKDRMRRKLNEMVV